MNFEVLRLNKKRETFKLAHEISELKFTKFGLSHEKFYLWPWPKIFCKIPTFRYTTIKVTNLSKLPEIGILQTKLSPIVCSKDKRKEKYITLVKHSHT